MSNADKLCTHGHVCSNDNRFDGGETEILKKANVTKIEMWRVSSFWYRDAFCHR